MHTATDDWYVFEPTNNHDAPSAIGMEAWLDAPAGRRGGVRIEGDHFVLADGTPIKFWGVNNGNLGCAPPHDEAVERAKQYQRFGVNAVRLHKFTNADGGIGSDQTLLEFDPRKMDQFDHYLKQLRDRGVYYGFSHVYRTQPVPGDAKHFKAYDEIMTVQRNDAGEVVGLEGSTIGFKMFARDVQDYHIQHTLNLLNHVNPYTGLRYAEDPALAFVELHNEDDIFFPTTHSAAMKAPTYKKMFSAMFTDWLKRKYGSQAKLEEAWGRGLNAYPEFAENESLEAGNIYPIAHHWYLSPEGVAHEEENRGAGRRLRDTARFLYEVQNEYYQRFENAVREAGYEGPIVGSCWQAGEGAPHYYNLHSDYLVGFIDRHNYTGGSGSHGIQTGPVRNNSMLEKPGSAILSTGMQQVADRPFALSEWIVKIPTEWTAEGPAIIATYGLGLQGWDASYHFASGLHRFSRTIQGEGGGNAYNAQNPTQIGQYPTLARMVYRGDVREGAIVARRPVHVESLDEKGLAFEERVEQDWDVKTIEGDVPAEALAAGRVVVEFVDDPDPKVEPYDRDEYRRDGDVVATTGQLRWRPRTEQSRGYFTLDSEGTKAVVGFAPKQAYELGGVTIEPDNHFASIYLTAAEPEATIAAGDRLLITAFARAYNTGMAYNEEHTEVVSVGKAPIRMEPVRATFRFDRPGSFKVHVLDHDGRRTGRSLEVSDGTFRIDGATDRTPYYEVVFD